jgi:aryl-alcohol dehydrogenase-like predicted oxidoreductase
MLKRLRTDRIDLLYQHRVDPAVPIERRCCEQSKTLLHEGKSVALRTFRTRTTNRKTLHMPYIVAHCADSTNIHSSGRGPENVIISARQELGIGFVPWSSLGVGFLTGASSTQIQGLLPATFA